MIFGEHNRSVIQSIYSSSGTADGKRGSLATLKILALFMYFARVTSSTIISNVLNFGIVKKCFS